MGSSWPEAWRRTWPAWSTPSGAPADSPTPTPEAGPSEVPVGTLDVVMHRDDVGIRPLLPEAPASIPVDLNGTTVVLTDDVLFTGRTVRAALDALADWGAPGPSSWP
ncbi:MAG: phosphoribosyltransferase family protein [Microthrixaceae bacterium]